LADLLDLAGARELEVEPARPAALEHGIAPELRAVDADRDLGVAGQPAEHARVRLEEIRRHDLAARDRLAVRREACHRGDDRDEHDNGEASHLAILLQLGLRVDHSVGATGAGSAFGCSTTAASGVTSSVALSSSVF